MMDRASIQDIDVVDYLELALRELESGSPSLHRVKFLVNAALGLASDSRNSADSGPKKNEEVNQVLDNCRKYLESRECDEEKTEKSPLEQMSYEEIIDFLKKHPPKNPLDEYFRPHEEDDVPLTGKVVNMGGNLKKIVPYQHTFDIIDDHGYLQRGLKAKNKEELLRLLNATRCGGDPEPVILKEMDQNGNVIFDAEAYGWKIPDGECHEAPKPEFIDDQKKVIKIMRSLEPVSSDKLRKRASKNTKTQKRTRK